MEIYLAPWYTAWFAVPRSQPHSDFDHLSMYNDPPYAVVEHSTFFAQLRPK